MNPFIFSAFADEAAESLPQQMEALHENGIRYLELRNMDGKNICTLPQADVAAVHRLLQSEGIGLSAIGSPLGKIHIADDFAPHLDMTKRVVDLAVKLGARRIRIFSFYLPQNENAALHRQKVLDQLHAMLEIAESAGILLCHENEHHIYGEDAKKCADLFAHFGGRLGGIFDGANFVQAGQDAQDALTCLLPYLTYLHIKDAIKGSGHAVPAGRGDGAIAQTLVQFYALYGGCFLTLEPHLAEFAGLAAQHVGGEQEGIIRKGTYGDNRQAFAVGASALKNLLVELNLPYQ